jgi:phosphoserine phosphatase RsbX
LRTTVLDRNVREIMNELHRALAGTRGAAAMICKWNAVEGRLQGVGVGNVELASAKVKVPVMLTPGIIGSNMRTLHVFEAPLGIGSRIVLFSDGISTSIMGDDLAARPHGAACEGLMEKFRKKHDDATVMVADVEGES